jgi:cytochrome-b5 reductase
VFYVVDKPTQDWKGGKGYLNNDTLLKGLPAPSDDTLILVYLVSNPVFTIRD